MGISISKMPIGVALLLLGVACATFDGRKQLERFQESIGLYEDAPIVDIQFAEIQYSNLSSEKNQIEIDGSGQKISLPHGPSFFSAHQLPKLNRPLRLKVVSVLTPGDFIPSSLMIYPYVTALDHEYELVESVPLIAVRYHTGFFGGSGVLWKYETPKDAEYIIFHTSNERFGEAYPVRY